MANRLLAPSIKGEFLRLLSTTTINDFMPELNVVLIDRETPIKEVLEQLNKANMMSAPIVDSSQNDKFVGMFDLEDFIFRYIKEGKDEGFLEKPVSKFINPSTFYEVFHPVASDLSLYHMMELFTRGTHRVPVTDNHLKIVSIVSQSVTVRFLNKNASKIGDHLEKFVEDLGLGMRGVVTVPSSMPASEAYDTMYKNGISALAVVDGDGKFEADISDENLRGILPESFDKLDMPVGEFIKAMPGLDEKTAQKCTLSTLFKDLLSQFASTRCHRIWVENSKGQLKGVITLTDVVKALLKTMNMTSHEKVRRRSIA